MRAHIRNMLGALPNIYATSIMKDERKYKISGEINFEMKILRKYTIPHVKLSTKCGNTVKVKYLALYY